MLFYFKIFSNGAKQYYNIFSSNLTFNSSTIVYTLVQQRHLATRLDRPESWYSNICLHLFGPGGEMINSCHITCAVFK